MKKAFTMIELIFVIVILGILAAVAIPKLNATRDDAELSKALNDFSTLIVDLTSYYTAKGDFTGGISNMTNVALNPVGSNDLSTYPAGYFGIKDAKNCLYVEAEGRSISGVKKTNYILLRKQDDSKEICKKLITKIDELRLYGDAYTDKTLQTQATTFNGSSVYIKVGSSSVNW